MASVTLGPAEGWTVGETITAYALDARGSRTGASVATGTIGANSKVTLTVADNGRFEATDGNVIVRFNTLLDPDTGSGSGGTGPSSVQRLVHGSTAAATRPATSGMVIWVGSVQPANMTAYDLWVNA